MAENNRQKSAIVHGASELPLVTVDSYNLELRSGEGFLGDRANRSAFWNILDSWRERLSEVDEDPIADLPKKKISKKTLEDLLAEGTGEQAGLIMGAIEDFARDFAGVIGRFLKHELLEGNGTDRRRRRHARRAPGRNGDRTHQRDPQGRGRRGRTRPHPPRSGRGGARGSEPAHAGLDVQGTRRPAGGRHRRHEHPRRRRRTEVRQVRIARRMRGPASLASGSMRRKRRAAPPRSPASRICSRRRPPAPRRPAWRWRR